MIKREAEKALKIFAQGYPVIVITGPRQSGKTTLARHVFKDRDYVSLENPDIREWADADPRGFLEKYTQGALFDEAQRSPVLFSYLQQIVDEDPTPGRFILTGSQQFGLMSKISQSLAGRAATVELLPFTYHELHGQRTAKHQPTLDELLFQGLYPPIHDKKLNARLWYSQYMRTYVERDVRQMVHVKDLTSFQRFVRLCAGRIGQLTNLSSLANDCGVTRNTAKSWLSILEASYLIFFLQPHHRNFNKRLIKTHKLYFYDPGLASWLLGIQDEKQLNTHSMRGPLFESWVVSELLKQQFNTGLPGNIFFWRDRHGDEVDVLIDQGSYLIPLEIKSGKTINSGFFTGLHKWLALAGETAKHPVLIYGGDESLTHSGIRVISWRAPIDFDQAAGSNRLRRNNHV